MSPRVASIAFAAITIVVAIGGCSSGTGTTTTSAPNTTETQTPVSPFDDSDLIAQYQRSYATTIIETVHAGGGGENLILAALVAGKAETDWMTGVSSGRGEVRDIYGWTNVNRYGAADSGDAVIGATNNFLKVAATVSVDDRDPVVYALAVQRADPRGYDEKDHFRHEEAADEEYARALPAARTALDELRKDR